MRGRGYRIQHTVTAALKITVLLVLASWVFAPFVSVVLWSVARKWYWPSLLPQELGLDYWYEALGLRRGYALTAAVGIIDALKTSIVIALIVTVITELISLPTAYALAKWRIPLKPLLVFLFLMPQAFPLQPVYVNLLLIFYRLGLAGTVPGVVIAHIIPCLVYAVWINAATFKSIPPDYEESARVHGAGPLTTFFRITLPLSAPGLIASSVFVFLYSFDEFTGTFFIGLPNVVTLPMLLYSASGYNMQFASAVAITLLIPSIIFMVVLERFLKSEYIAKIG